MKITDFGFDSFERSLYDLSEGYEAVSGFDHNGHRRRLRERFAEGGEGAISKVELLEALLYNLYPQCDTRPVAIRLIDRFRGLGGVFEASPDDINGCFDPSSDGTESETALFLKAVCDVCRFYAYDSGEFRLDLRNFFTAERYYRNIFGSSGSEAVCVTALCDDGYAGECAVFTSDSFGSDWTCAAPLVSRFLSGGDHRSCVIAHYIPSGSRKDAEYRKKVTSFIDAIGVAAGIGEFFTMRGSTLRPVFGRMKY